jgi:hypothetical protein
MMEARAPYPISPQPMQKSWLDRNAGWKIPLGCLLVVLLIVGFIGLIFSIVSTSFHKSYVFQEAVARAERNPEVAEKIGTPLRPSWMPMGQINVNGSSGNANMTIPVTGPRGKGTIHLEAQKVSGVWRFRILEVRVEGQTGAINLLGPDDAVTTQL